MTELNFVCKKCRREFDCDVGEISFPIEENRPRFEIYGRTRMIRRKIEQCQKRITKDLRRCSDCSIEGIIGYGRPHNSWST